MNSLKIQDELHKRNLNYRRIGEALGVSGNYVAGIANRNNTSYRIACAIAKAIDKSVSDVFPDKYTNNPVSESQAVEELRQKLAS